MILKLRMSQNGENFYCIVSLNVMGAQIALTPRSCCIWIGIQVLDWNKVIQKLNSLAYMLNPHADVTCFLGAGI